MFWKTTYPFLNNMDDWIYRGFGLYLISHVLVACMHILIVLVLLKLFYTHAGCFVEHIIYETKLSVKSSWINTSKYQDHPILQSESTLIKQDDLAWFLLGNFSAQLIISLSMQWLLWQHQNYMIMWLLPTPLSAWKMSLPPPPPYSH